jgi:hypothetical protein
VEDAVRRLPAAFFCGVVEGRFCRGFCEKTVFRCGVFVVKLWWIAGNSWCVDGRFSASKNMPLFLTLFSAGFLRLCG